MISIPKECCDVGTYECAVLMPINGRIRGIDICISDIVAALNASNIDTIASCCGHGENDGFIYLGDGREIIIKKEYIILKKKGNNHHENQIG